VYAGKKICQLISLAYAQISFTGAQKKNKIVLKNSEYCNEERSDNCSAIDYWQSCQGLLLFGAILLPVYPRGCCCVALSSEQRRLIPLQEG
jgi:hypothetical protein